MNRSWINNLIIQKKEKPKSNHQNSIPILVLIQVSSGFDGSVSKFTRAQPTYGQDDHNAQIFFDLKLFFWAKQWFSGLLNLISNPKGINSVKSHVWSCRPRWWCCFWTLHLIIDSRYLKPQTTEVIKKIGRKTFFTQGLLK